MSDYFSLSEFTVDAVYDHIGLTPDMVTERDAARFVFQHFSKGEYKLENRSEIVTQTIERLTPRFDMLNAQAEEFFNNETPQWPALIMAVLCDDLLMDANNLKEDENGDPLPDQIKDFQDDDSVHLAAEYFETATDLTERGIFPDEDIPLEAIFLAHINAIEESYERIDRIDTYDLAELLTIQNKEIPAIHSFLRADTEIGRNLLDALTTLESTVAQRIPNADIVAIPDKSKLRSVFKESATILSFKKEEPPIDPDVEPIDYLFEQYAPMKNEAVMGAIHAVWNALYEHNSESYDSTMYEARQHLEKQIALFSFYEKDYDASPEEKQTALCSWLINNTIDPHHDEYWDFMSEKTLAVLVVMQDNTMYMPFLSAAFDDKALGLHVGLTIINSLHQIKADYQPNPKNLKRSFEDQEVDHDYALRLLKDDDSALPPCQLFHDIRQTAAEIVKLAAPRQKRQLFHLVK